MSLYTVSFTTKKIVTRYGAKREVLGSSEQDVPVTIKGLPLATAQTYAKCDNFAMEKQFAQADAKVSYRRSSRNGKAYRDYDVGGTAPAARPKRDKKMDAAATGDMGAALNG